MYKPFVMRYLILPLALCLTFLSVNAQDNKEIATAYFKKALKSYEEKNIEKTEKYLDKNISYFGGIENNEIATFGANFFFEKKDYIKSKVYLTAFFKLNKDKKSKIYTDMLFLYTDVLDEIDAPVNIKKENGVPSLKVIADTINLQLEKKPTIIDQKKLNVEEEVIDILDDEIVEDVSFTIIEDVPVYPGCLGSKAALKTCFSNSVQNHFARNFNSDLPNQLGLIAGRKRVFIGFKIDKKGKVVNIMVRAPHPKIKEEVIRVMNLMPLMKPGTQRGKPIGVKYSIPFTLIVEGEVEIEKKG
jgi:protein TonB